MAITDLTKVAIEGYHFGRRHSIRNGRPGSLAVFAAVRPLEPYEKPEGRGRPGAASSPGVPANPSPPACPASRRPKQRLHGGTPRLRVRDDPLHIRRRRLGRRPGHRAAARPALRSGDPESARRRLSCSYRRLGRAGPRATALHGARVLRAGKEGPGETIEDGRSNFSDSRRPQRFKFFDRLEFKFSDPTPAGRSRSPFLMQFVFHSKCRARNALRRDTRDWPIPCSLCTPPPANSGWRLGAGKENA